MGQTYSVYLKLKVKNQDAAVKALQQKIAKGEEEHTNYSLEHYKEIGITPDTLEGLLKIIFGGWKGILEKKENRWNVKLEKLEPFNDGFDHYSADFDCCYGWENVMMRAFDALAPALEDNSQIDIYPDSGVDTAIITNQKAVWIS